MVPTFFETADEFRQWLAENHGSAKELLVGFYKVNSGKPSLTWSQAVDQALCFGWIDGIRKSIDVHSYCIRFTPRKSNSIWSTVNLKKVEELTQQGLMQPAGFAAFAQRQAAKSQIYSYEQAPAALDAALQAHFQANAPAWAFFQAQPPSYRRKILHWIMSAKQPTTRLSRLERVIHGSAAGMRV